MRKIYGVILVSVVITGLLLVTALPCLAVETQEKNIATTVPLADKPTATPQEDKSLIPPNQQEPKEEMINRMLKRLSETDPGKAKELDQLRDKDPEKFKAEMRKIIWEHFGKKAGERMKQYAEGLEGWLKKNYPEEAEKLAELRGKNPELYQRKMELNLRRFSRIVEAERENPALAEVLKNDMKLKIERDQLCRQIKAAASEDKKKELIGQLEKVVSSRYDLILKRKQIEYEQLSKRLEELQKEVKKNAAEVEKWKDAKFKDENVKKHIKELISKAEKFEWN